MSAAPTVMRPVPTDPLRLRLEAELARERDLARELADCRWAIQGLLAVLADGGRPAPDEEGVEYYSPSEIAKRLSVTSVKVYDMCRTGELPSIHVGTAVRVPVEGFRAWQRRQTGRASDRGGD